MIHTAIKNEIDIITLNTVNFMICEPGSAIHGPRIHDPQLILANSASKKLA
jgi:hypothetical protein